MRLNSTTSLWILASILYSGSYTVRYLCMIRKAETSQQLGWSLRSPKEKQCDCSFDPNQCYRRLPLSTSPSMAAPVAAVHSKLLAFKVPAVAPFTTDNCMRSNHCSVSRRAKLASFTPVKHQGSLRRTLRIVAARTESADLPLGNKVPDFQVKLWYNFLYAYCYCAYLLGR